MHANSETRVARQIGKDKQLCKQASKLLIFSYLPLLIRAKKTHPPSFLRRRDITITCYHFHSRKPLDLRLIKYHHSPAGLYTISRLVPFNTLRYNRRSRQNLSSPVQSCHSKAIFHLPFLVLSQHNLLILPSPAS